MSRPSLARRDVHLRELMDDPDCDPQRLQTTLRRFGVVNRFVSGWDVLYRKRIRPMLQNQGGTGRILDVGSGGGDVIRRLSSLAEKDGFTVRWTGVDPDPRAYETSSAASPPNAQFLCTDAEAMWSTGERFDLVISNHVLHHLGADELTSFAEYSRRLSSGLVLHSDISRSRLAYGLYSAAILPVAPGTFLRVDGLRSIRRSYTPAELAATLGSPWRTSVPYPFRVLAEAPGSA
ncbi:methyltransferase domain-containing protein [Nesterenkonia massiliensis]|uniref:Methyltransferase domain-containing protein n=1 Tax=Nesterenkonia massiliensis TaxID=1232429 RepID=A0ABT2HQN4_9MICC|nr:methyltransferase domain-containing protein [Nesterenkonia massiliensis]MCT1607002.1 methyltransferase domain-containing protein [Nesterenkonia massiliensis]